MMTRRLTTRVYVQGIGTPHSYNLTIAKALAHQENLSVTLGDETLRNILRAIQIQRSVKNLDLTLLPFISEKGKIISKRVVGVLMPLYIRFLSGFDVLHLNWLQCSYVGVAINDVKRPKVFTFHDHTLAVENDAEKLNQVQQMLSRVDVVTAPSKFMAAVLRSKVGCKPIVVYHGVDTRLFSPQVHKSCDCRSALKIPKDRKVVFWNGRLAPEKALQTLLDAIPEVVKHVPSALFLIKGTNSGHSKYRKKILEYAHKKMKEYGWKSNVRFVTKSVRFEELPVYYGAADVFVHTSTLEAFGLVLAEAMACMLPVVAADASSSPEVVGDAGLLFRAEDSNSLAETLIELLSDEQLRATLGKRGHERVSNIFTSDNMAKNYKGLYLDLKAAH
jgi:glycosyltransferase involved in cell wall biosynthesis